MSLARLLSLSLLGSVACGAEQPIVDSSGSSDAGGGRVSAGNAADDSPSSAGSSSDSDTDATSGESGSCTPACEGKVCGPDGCSGECGRCESEQACSDAGLCEALVTAVFVFDQHQDAVFRLEDRDGDGYMFAADEIAVFIDGSVPSTGVTNAQGLLAEGPNLLWATDNYDPTHIVRVEDLDGDGTALQSGESSVFFSGPLPGGFPFRNPTSVHRSPDGALYFTHNNVVSPTTISGIFRLQDLDGNGDANGADEATGLWELAGTESFGSSVSDMAVADATTLFLIEHIGGGEATHLDRIDIETGERDRFLDGDSLTLAQMLSLPSGSSAVGWLASTSEAVVQATGNDGRTVLIAAGDDDGNGIADPTAEVRVLVDEQQHPQMAGAGFIDDFVVAADETLYWVTPEGGNVWAAYDEDGDGSYETVVRIYAPASSTATVALQRPQSLAVFRGAATVSP